MISDSIDAIVIGTSAGAVEALSMLLPHLPGDLPVPVIVVVHVPPDKRSIMASLMASKCPLRVKEAEDKEPLAPSTIYFAVPDYHLLVEADKTLALSNDEPVSFSRPSIDVLFESAADAFGKRLIAIVLTGANHDGADGARAIIDVGGTVLVQDPQTAFASTMPQEAIRACGTAKVLSIAGILKYLEEL